jgi:hypothetical protein
MRIQRLTWMTLRYLALIVVDHTVWKRGIGRKLVQWGLDEAQQDDAFLEASLMGEPFYWKLGFKTLGWDSIKEENAPSGICKWPFMIKRGKGVKLSESSVVIGPIQVEDCEEVVDLAKLAFSVDAHTPTARLRNPPVSEEVEAQRKKARIEHLTKQIQDGNGSKYIKAEIDGIIVGYAEWVPPGKDHMQAPKGDDLSFNQRYVGKVIETRRQVMKGKKYW